jgi:hypothetical protein
MQSDRGLQETVTQNVRVLMAVQRIDQQQDLAQVLGWHPTKLTKSLRGDRKWALDDLPDLARALGTTPGALIGDTAELVGAVASAKAAGGMITEAHIRGYRPAHLTLVPGFPQATDNELAPAQVA